MDLNPLQMSLNVDCRGERANELKTEKEIHVDSADKVTASKVFVRYLVSRFTTNTSHNNCFLLI